MKLNKLRSSMGWCPECGCGVPYDKQAQAAHTDWHNDTPGKTADQTEMLRAQRARFAHHAADPSDEPAPDAPTRPPAGLLRALDPSVIRGGVASPDEPAVCGWPLSEWDRCTRPADHEGECA